MEPKETMFKCCEPLKKPTMRDTVSELSIRSEDLLANVRRLKGNMFGDNSDTISVNDKKEPTFLEDELEINLEKINEAQRVIGEIFDMIGI